MDPFVPVFRGQTFEAADLQSRLEEAGIEVVSIYMAHGAGTELQVPRVRAEEALRFVQSEARRKSHLPDPLDEFDPETESLRALSKRIGPLAMSIVGAPAGFVLGIVYFVRVRRLGRQPADHAHIIMAWTASVLMTLVVAFLLLTFWVHA
jgi:hypothetical protein